jgi:dethiobiotin synthetase
VDLFVTGTDTDVGKTVLSALLVAALPAAYWKPIQTGREEGRSRTDREAVLAWTAMDPAYAFAETYVFDPPVSPHLAARRAGVAIGLDSIRKPNTSGLRLVIEGAGGAMVPINDTDLMLDLMTRLDARIVIATRTTLGTINHTLLTLDAVRQKGLELAGVVMIGEENIDNREAIERYGGAPVVGWIPPLRQIDRDALTEVFESRFDRSALSGGA